MSETRAVRICVMIRCNDTCQSVLGIACASMAPGQLDVGKFGSLETLTYEQMKLFELSGSNVETICHPPNCSETVDVLINA